MANDSEFSYEPLNSSAHQIRLLRILPTTTDIDILCKLQTSDLTEEGPSTPFAAISYEWGSETVLKAITVNGKQFWVRQNCHYALLQAHRHLCNTDGPGLIWVDSICINQDDIDERSKQVALMGKLYSAAHVVLACVGPAQRDSDWMLRVLESVRLNHASICWKDEISTAVHNVEGSKLALDEASKNRLHKRFHKAAIFFSTRTYWRRRLIVQEVLLPRVVVVLCGNCHYDFDVWSHIQVPGFVGHIAVIISLRRKGWELDVSSNSRFHEFEKRCLAELLSSLEAQTCSERHDYIYALLGVSKFTADKKGTSLVPDYRRSYLNTALLTTDVVLHCARHTGSVIDKNAVYVSEIIDGLCLSPGQEDVQNLFRRRRRERTADPQDDTRGEVHTRSRDAGSTRSRGSIHQLSMDESGVLEVSGFQQLEYPLRYCDIPDGYRPFTSSAGPLIGYASSSVLPGDFLVHVHSIPWLVIRWDAELDIFRFVGRGFLFGNARTNHCHYCLDKQSTHIDSGPSPVDMCTFVFLYFDVEDLVALLLYEEFHVSSTYRSLLSQPVLEEYPITRTSLSSYAFRD